MKWIKIYHAVNKEIEILEGIRDYAEERFSPEMNADLEILYQMFDLCRKFSEFDELYMSESFIHTGPGWWIKENREKMGLTRTGLAKKVGGISPTRIKEYEEGKHKWISTSLYFRFRKVFPPPGL